MNKKYGLIWEDHPEPIEELLKTHEVVLEEIKERELKLGETNSPQHLLIEGDNYEALTYLKQELLGKVDVIYIDPPYNTKNKTFKYNDHYENHSKWLSFMSKRLLLAKELMSEDGVIFISIDDNEVAQLKLLCDETFGERNFLNLLIWHYGKMSNETRKFANNHEYVLIYGKSNKSKVIPSYKKEDTEYKNRWLKYVKNNKIYYGDIKDKKDKMLSKRIEKIKKHTTLTDSTIIYDFDSEYKVDSDVIYVPIIKGNSNEKEKNFGLGQKPIELMKRILTSYPKKEAVFFDFFAGSGTTGHAVLELNQEDGGNRQFILCTNNENNICEEVTYERLKRVINGCSTSKGREVEGIPANLKYLKTKLEPKEEEQ